MTKNQQIIDQKLDDILAEIRTLQLATEHPNLKPRSEYTDYDRRQFLIPATDIEDADCCATCANSCPSVLATYRLFCGPRNEHNHLWECCPQYDRKEKRKPRQNPGKTK